MRCAMLALMLSIAACSPEAMSPEGAWRTQIAFTAPQADPTCDFIIGPSSPGGLFSLTVDADWDLTEIRFDDVEYRDLASLSIECDVDTCYMRVVYGATYHENDYTTTVVYTYAGRALDDDRSVAASGQVSWHAVDDRTGGVEYDCVGSWIGTGNLRQP